MAIRIPAVEVRFRDLTITAKVQKAAPKGIDAKHSLKARRHAVPSAAGRASQPSRLPIPPAPALLHERKPRPTTPRAPQRTLTGAGKAKRVLVDHVSGILRPARYTLLLGTPGSGKTLLMRALTGQLKSEQNLKACCAGHVLHITTAEGHSPALLGTLPASTSPSVLIVPDPQTTAEELTLNGRTFDQFVLERSMAYVSQRDVHIAELTVRETLDFSARCHGPSKVAGKPGHGDRRLRGRGLPLRHHRKGSLAAPQAAGLGTRALGRR